MYYSTLQCSSNGSKLLLVTNIWDCSSIMLEEEKSFTLSELITAVSLSPWEVSISSPLTRLGGAFFTSFEVNLRLSKKGYLIESDTYSRFLSEPSNSFGISVFARLRYRCVFK